MRVYEFSKKYNIPTKELLEVLQEGGFSVKNHMVALDEDAIDFLTSYVRADREIAHEKRGDVQEVVTPEVQEPVAQSIVLESRPLSLGEIALKMNKSVNDVILTLLRWGIAATKNQILSEAVIKRLADHYHLELVKQPAIQQEVAGKIVVKDGNLQERSPIIVVIGHVDHGKTTLLDYIRSTRVAAREKGGITQHLGAYEAVVPQGKIVFLDTPGHEAFFKIRQRGIRVADIAVLVVAADDGVMPQTIEAIKYAKSMNVPIIVAINKIDKVDARQLEIVKRQLAQQDLLPEEWGGDIICVPISSKSGQGVDKLLEMVILQSQIMELRADISGPAKGYILESKIERGHGPVATVICHHGNIAVGDYFVSGNVYGRVTAIIDSFGKKRHKVGPAVPIQISGFSSLPEVGDYFGVVSKQDYLKAKQQSGDVQKEFAMRSTSQDKESMINLLVKTDTNSTKEALLESINRLSKKLNAHFNIISSGIGAISESDVELAYTTGAKIVGLHVKIETNASMLASKRSVSIVLFDIIYKLLESLEALFESSKAVEMVRKKIGEAKVLRVFDIKNIGVVAGSLVTDGRFVRNGIIVVYRDNRKIGEGKITSLQREKKTVKEVHTGFECGFIVENFSDWAVDDKAECYIEEPKK